MWWLILCVCSYRENFWDQVINSINKVLNFVRTWLCPVLSVLLSWQNQNKDDEFLRCCYYFYCDFCFLRSNKSSCHSAGMGGCAHQSVCQGSNEFFIFQIQSQDCYLFSNNIIIFLKKKKTNYVYKFPWNQSSSSFFQWKRVCDW